jgi:hypothetical protein
MAIALGEQELEGLGEVESEFETELEGEMPEMFGLDDITNWAGNQWTALNTPGSWQRKALLATDKAILTGGGAALGGYLGGTPGALAGGALGAGAATLLPDKEFESEFETEFESEFETEFESETEFEGEGEISPVSRIYPDAMLEHLGHAAMESESELEAAEGFLPLIPLVASKLIPLAARAAPRIAGRVLPRVLPRVARVFTRVTPQLTRGVTNLSRTLYRNPRTRPLLRVIPSIARRAVTTIARRAAAGRPVTPQAAVRILAGQNHRVLSNPQIVQSVLRRSNLMDRRYHRLSGIPAVGRNYRWRWRNGMLQPATTSVDGFRPGIVGPSAIGGTRFCPRCGTATVVTPRAGASCCGPVVVVR